MMVLFSRFSKGGLGTDSISWVLESASSALQSEFGSDIQLHHVASCDICPKARKFIAEHHEPDYIFGDMRQLSSPMAYDYLSEKVVAVPKNARATTPTMIQGGIAISYLVSFLRKLTHPL